jgi:hypothetical protein
MTMLTDPIRVHVAPDSELARLLDEMTGTSILLEKNGELYRLTKEEDTKRSSHSRRRHPQIWPSS